jgi:hypothetical protein
MLFKKKKEAGSMAQVIEFLPTKREALNSKYLPPKKKEKKSL